MLNTAIHDIAAKLISGPDSEELRQAYTEALESHDAPIVLLDANGIVRYLNHAALSMAHAKAAGQLIGLSAEDTQLPWHSGSKSIKARLMQGESTMSFEHNRRGYVCEAEVLHGRLNEPVGFLEFVRAEGAWTYRDEGLDELTGIATKSRFFAETRHLIDYNPDVRYAIVYWGVIRFKLINDVFSPATGESVLKNIAQTIEAFVGEEGTCGRFGDDSFVFCVPAERLDASWFGMHSEVTLMSDTAMYTFKSTFGVYEVDDLANTVQSMCEHAAFAQSSISGAYDADGNCFAFYDKNMHEGILEEQELVSQLSYALNSDQIKVYFQPIYSIATGNVASAEALARWEHPQKTIVFPGRFIPLFESNGMITELDKHVWDKVAGFLEKRLAAGSKVVPISTNVSRVDFFSTFLLDDFDEIVTSHDLPRELLRIEVTESAYTDDPQRIIDMVSTLRNEGHTVLLDDFGSGYSSLNTLKDMAIDIVKLDMSFLRDFDTDSRTKHIIRHVVAMSHDLGLKVVAEGVETLEQLEFLRSVGCDLAQGYYFARPLPESDFVALLDEPGA